MHYEYNEEWGGDLFVYERGTYNRGASCIFTDLLSPRGETRRRRGAGSGQWFGGVVMWGFAVVVDPGTLNTLLDEVDFTDEGTDRAYVTQAHTPSDSVIPIGIAPITAQENIAESSQSTYFLSLALQGWPRMFPWPMLTISPAYKARQLRRDDPPRTPAEEREATWATHAAGDTAYIHSHLSNNRCLRPARPWDM